MLGFILGCVAVVWFRKYAFHGTNPMEFVLDLAIVFGVMFGVNSLF